MNDTDQAYTTRSSRNESHVRVTRIQSGSNRRRIASRENIFTEPIIAKDTSKRRDSTASHVTVTRLSTYSEKIFL